MVSLKDIKNKNLYVMFGGKDVKRLEGIRIALAGKRKSEDLSKLVKNLGGIPLIRPAQGTVFLDDSNLEKDVRHLVKGSYDWFILTTGVGTETLYKTAEKLGLADEFIQAISRAKVAARGYKTVNMLKRFGIAPDVRDDDGSTAGLVRALSSHDLKGAKVALQLHGDPAPKLVHFLEEQQAEYKEVLPYQHIPPEPEVLEQLLDEILNGKVDAVNFTSAPQGRFLFSFAKEKGVFQELMDAFSKDVVAVAVGKVTAAALKDEGIERIVIPQEERMGSAIIALEHYYKEKTTK
ncbi:uroporphyrinogen-III synthase [Bacillus capparidis]|uniref:Uroporphyrinogen-III synthase n=1 Tax=Bacillus capparidis TaxID=1840411 RepID=A0ABS4D264_9BACI|nr:uroporphyrinogen-III synthase [Bacillus capparidis]